MKDYRNPFPFAVNEMFFISDPVPHGRCRVQNFL